MPLFELPPIPNVSYRSNPRQPHHILPHYRLITSYREKVSNHMERPLRKGHVNACRYVDGINMTFAQGAFHVIGDLLPITGDKPVMREDGVRLPGIRPVADIRYRGEFKKWHIDVPIRYNMAAITPEQIINLLSVAGFAVGLGEWRPGRGGAFGMFDVDSTSKRKVKEA